MPGSTQIGVHNITSDALTIAGMGVAIVFVALAMITLVIAGLPRILETVATVFPEPANHRVPVPEAGTNAEAERIVALSVAAITARRSKP